MIQSSRLILTSSLRSNRGQFLWNSGRNSTACSSWFKIQRNDITCRTLSSQIVERTDASITYSGGQPNKGQGGFYGSGGARSTTPPLPPQSSGTITDQQRSQMIGLAADVEHITMIMEELELLEGLLKKDQEENDNKVTNRSIELRGSIKHLITNKDFFACLDRLEYQGKPIWGLSSDEHDLILLAREKINQC